MWVLDPAIERWKPADGAGGAPPAAPTQSPPLWAPIEIDPAGKEITFSWLQERPAGETIVRVDGIETGTAVSLAVMVDPKAPEPGIGGYTLQGITRRITAWLDKPLGSRVRRIARRGDRGHPRRKLFREAVPNASIRHRSLGDALKRRDHTRPGD
jgi:hypothetical protein